jgi:hypothetical protein
LADFTFEFQGLARLSQYVGQIPGAACISPAWFFGAGVPGNKSGSFLCAGNHKVTS